jgi:hypothetical protein
METGRAVGICRAPAAHPHRHQPSRAGQARGQRRARLLRETFGRPSGEPLPWFDAGAEPNADLWATDDESRPDILELYQRARAHSDIVRELIDGAVGLRQDNDNMPPGDWEWWDSYRQRVERSALSRRRLV